LVAACGGGVARIGEARPTFDRYGGHGCDRNSRVEENPDTGRCGLQESLLADCLDLPERPAPLDKLMTKDKARKIAAGIAKLPELLNASRN
jgi:hypothetical protein